VPTTTPPAAKAPKMPRTRPRTSGVLLTNDQPWVNSRSMPGLCSTAAVRRPLISRMPKNTVIAVARNVSALNHSATLLGLAQAGSSWPNTATTSHCRPMSTSAAATGVTP
jgi:hypothetical protein